MSLYLHDGKLLKNAGALATDVNCCCYQCNTCEEAFARMVGVYLDISGFQDVTNTYEDVVTCYKWPYGNIAVGDRVKHSYCSNINGFYSLLYDSEANPGCAELIWASGEPGDPGTLIATDTSSWPGPPTCSIPAGTIEVRHYLRGVGICFGCTLVGLEEHVYWFQPYYYTTSEIYDNGVLRPPSSSATDDQCCIYPGVIDYGDTIPAIDFCNGLTTEQHATQYDCDSVEIGTVTYVVGNLVSVA